MGRHFRKIRRLDIFVLLRSALAGSFFHGQDDTGVSCNCNPFCSQARSHSMTAVEKPELAINQGQQTVAGR